jgi:hypothetical protein
MISTYLIKNVIALKKTAEYFFFYFSDEEEGCACKTMIRN